MVPIATTVTDFGGGYFTRMWIMLVSHRGSGLSQLVGQHCDLAQQMQQLQEIQGLEDLVLRLEAVELNYSFFKMVPLT